MGEPVFGWRFYDPREQPEIDYLGDLRAEPGGAPLPALQGEAARPRSADSHMLLLSVAESIESRIHAQGRLGQEHARRREPGEELSEDEFIERDEFEGQTQRYACRFADLFCFRGPKEDFQRSEPFLNLLREYNEGRCPPVRKRRLRRTKAAPEPEPPLCRVVKTAPIAPRGGVFATFQQISGGLPPTTREAR